MTPTDFEFDELKREFLVEARQKIEEIASAFSALDAQSLDRLINLAHQLKGAGGSYGFQAISTDGAALEKALEQYGETKSPESQREVRERLDRLKSETTKRISELEKPTAP